MTGMMIYLILFTSVLVYACCLDIFLLLRASLFILRNVVIWAKIIRSFSLPKPLTSQSNGEFPFLLPWPAYLTLVLEILPSQSQGTTLLLSTLWRLFFSLCEVFEPLFYFQSFDDLIQFHGFKMWWYWWPELCIWCLVPSSELQLSLHLDFSRAHRPQHIKHQLLVFSPDLLSTLVNDRQPAFPSLGPNPAPSLPPLCLIAPV